MAARVFVVAMSLLTVFLFSGTVFGWGAFSAMLIEQGYYDHLCERPDAGNPCEEQLQALNSVFTTATTVVSLTAFVNGWLVDMLGPTKMCILAGVLNFAGLVGIAATATEQGMHGDFDVFLWSTMLVAAGGSLTMFIGYQAPFIFPSHFSLLIGMNSCLFDASTIVFPTLKMFYEMGVPFAVCFWVYAAVCLACFYLFAISWASNEDELKAIRGSADESSTDTTPQQQRPLTQRSMLAQLKTFDFAAIFVYSLIMVPRSNMYMGTVSLINRNIAEHEGTLSSLEWIETATGFIIPFGFLVVPLIEISIRKLGTIATVHITTCLGLVYNGLQLIPGLHLQLATACIFASWRAFLFSVISAYNGKTFGVNTMGRVMGLCFFFAALCNILTGPLVNSAVAANNFSSLLVKDLAICFPLFLVFIALRRKKISREARELLLAAKSNSIQECFITP